jgi:hypothetical protein
VTVPAVPFDHLLRLSDGTGLFEHALLTVPRREHGYCLDDVARGLVVVSREPFPPPEVAALRDRYLRFVIAAQTPDGTVHNRLGPDGRWLDRPGLDDCWGRSLWGLGTAAARDPAGEHAGRALLHFRVGAGRRSPWPRAMAFAALGAAEVLRVRPGHPAALDLLAAAAATVGRPVPDDAWPWPEPRLSYANAVLAEALLAAGRGLGDGRLLDDGLRLLGWLLDTETRDGHLSVTPVGGWARGEPRPGFDQQPIEVAALADACARAVELTGDRRWQDGLDRAVAWFLGDNDARTPLHDPASGGGCDGLHPYGRNENQGAESTLALIATLQHAHRLAPASL